MSCSNRTLEVTTWVEKGRIGVAWEVEISDLRRLKGFHIGYCEVTSDDDFEKRLENEEDVSSSVRPNEDDDSQGDDSDDADDDLWTYVYVPYSQEASLHSTSVLKSSLKTRMHGLVNVRPFRRYALFVKADLMLDNNWANRSSLFEYDKVISRIVRVTSLPARKLSIILIN